MFQLNFCASGVKSLFCWASFRETNTSTQMPTSTIIFQLQKMTLFMDGCRQLNECVKDDKGCPPDWMSLLPDPLLWDPVVNGFNNCQPRVTFSEAQLAMNRHFYGESHGISTESLESSIHITRHVQTDGYYVAFDHYLRKSHTTPNLKGRASRSLTKQISQNWRFTHRAFARVIDNNLFVCRVHKIVGQPCQRMSLRGSSIALTSQSVNTAMVHQDSINFRLAGDSQHVYRHYTA